MHNSNTALIRLFCLPGTQDFKMHIVGPKLPNKKNNFSPNNFVLKKPESVF